MIRIPLRVSGVDLDDDVTLELLGEHLSGLTWSECDGVVLATLYTSAQNPVATALEAARRICHALPKAEVLHVDPELVSNSDIAFRLGVSREAVRLWVEGLRGPGNFPPALSVIGNGRSKVWPWAVVHAWVRQNYRIGDDETHLTAQQVAELNGALLRVKHPIDNEWETVSSFQQRVRPPDEAEHFHELLARVTERVLSTRAKGHMNWALDLAEGSTSSWVARYGSHDPDGYLEVTTQTAQVEELT
ncbi:helix-turn-helix transcriptional regulator [Micromonospora rubida]|uniref:Helix-turn-helix transcriptional regulator n=1 Tax=Micromonospora rubida TaxID=2697657 RepID=A0ABW7SKM7_9ACTN